MPRRSLTGSSSSPERRHERRNRDYDRPTRSNDYDYDKSSRSHHRDRRSERRYESPDRYERRDQRDRDRDRDRDNKRGRQDERRDRHHRDRRRSQTDESTERLRQLRRERQEEDRRRGGPVPYRGEFREDTPQERLLKRKLLREKFVPTPQHNQTPPEEYYTLLAEMRREIESTDSDSSSSSRGKKKKKKKKKKKHKKDKKDKKEKKSKKDKKAAEDSSPTKAVAISFGNDEGSESGDDFGPAPVNSDVGHVDYGGQMNKGEAEAMAAFVQANQRIPRRGEIGMTSDAIANVESLGFVMSQSRNNRMNIVRQRKEAQVATAEEKRQAIINARQERIERENSRIQQFRDILKSKGIDD